MGSGAWCQGPVLAPERTPWRQLGRGLLRRPTRRKDALRTFTHYSLNHTLASSYINYHGYGTTAFENFRTSRRSTQGDATSSPDKKPPLVICATAGPQADLVNRERRMRSVSTTKGNGRGHNRALRRTLAPSWALPCARSRTRLLLPAR